MRNCLTVATRGGALAMAQTRIVIEALRRRLPEVTFRIRPVVTTGDRDRRTALWDLKGTGFFTSQVEQLLLAGEADLAVHSFKDLPTRLRPELMIAAVCDRRYPEDCLVARQPVQAIRQLPARARVGTSSLRRVAQLKRLRPDMDVVSIRGNLLTRLRKLDSGDFDALLLARAGLERLHLTQRISVILDVQQFVPAAAQGALAVQTRSDDREVCEIVRTIDQRDARVACLAERRVLATMQCGCHAPVGVFAAVAGPSVEITAFVSETDGSGAIHRSIRGSAEQAEALAEKLADELLQAGAGEILQRLTKDDDGRGAS